MRDSLKKCSSCKEHRPLKEFSRSSRYDDGLNITCRACAHDKYIAARGTMVRDLHDAERMEIYRAKGSWAEMGAKAGITGEAYRRWAAKKDLQPNPAPKPTDYTRRYTPEMAWLEQLMVKYVRAGLMASVDDISSLMDTLHLEARGELSL